MTRAVNATVINDQQPARLTAAAERLNALFVQRFATVPDAKAETIIAGTARMAGTMLFRSFAPPGSSFEPGTTVLSDEANVKGPKLMDILFGTLRSAGHTITEQELDNRDATTEASQLSLEESQALLDQAVLAYCESAGLTFEDAAYALAIATALFVHDCRAMLDVRKGAAIAIYGFVEGCKTAPPVAAAHAQASTRDLQLAPMAERSPYATPAGAVAPAPAGVAPSLTKYILLFGGCYAGLMILAALAVSELGISSGGINSGVFIGVIYIVATKFVRDRRRLWLPGEKWRLVFGFLAVTLAFDFVITWLVSAGKMPLVVVAGATAFIGLFRLFGLWLFLGPLARQLFGRYAMNR